MIVIHIVVIAYRVADAKSLGCLEVSNMVDSIDVFASNVAFVNFLGVSVSLVELELTCHIVKSWRDHLELGILIIIAVEVVIGCVHVVLHHLFGHLGGWFMYDVLLAGCHLHIC